MKSVLITGGNQGIGFETARILVKQGYFVYLGCRSAEAGEEAARRLRNEGSSTVTWVQIDVTDQKSIEQAVSSVTHDRESLDVLINNAGIMGARPVAGENYPVEEIQRVFETNVFGVVRVTQAFLGLLGKSRSPRIVNVSSGLGSLTMHSDPNWRFSKYKHPAYMPSKTALNAYTVLLAAQLGNRGFKVNSVDPGHTSTAFNNYGGERPASESAVFVARAATIEDDGPNGRFLSDHLSGGELPW